MSVLAIRLRDGDAWIDARLKELATERNLEKSALARELLTAALAAGYASSQENTNSNSAAEAKLESLIEALAADLDAERAADRILALQTYRMALRAAVMAGAAAVSTGFVAEDDQKARLDELIVDSERLFAEAEAKLQALMREARAPPDRVGQPPEGRVPAGLDVDSTA